MFEETIFLWGKLKCLTTDAKLKINSINLDLGDTKIRFTPSHYIVSIQNNSLYSMRIIFLLVIHPFIKKPYEGGHVLQQ